MAIETDDWVPGRRLDKALDEALGMQIGRWARLVPELAAGRLLVRCESAQIYNIRASFRPKQELSALKTNWLVPAGAWRSVERDSFGGASCHVFEGMFAFTSLDETLSIEFLNYPEMVFVSAVGVEFHRGSVIHCFDLSAKEIAILDGVDPSETQLDKPRRRAAGAGAKVDAERWSQFAAAFAVLSERGELELPSEQGQYDAIATFLAQRGHDNPLSVDTVRQLLRRYRTWLADQPFPDDADYPQDG
ncbi:MAG: hypothetical protein WA842_04970 [Croceibacterium sp.]